MSMDAERWRRVDRLFEAALETPPEARSALLARECGRDDSLRLEVEALLASDREDGFLEDSGSADAARLLVNAERQRLVGRRIGRFEVLDVIGAGGMGEVYLGHDDTLQRQVALKLIPRHLAADVERGHRFRREALAASALNHPNIVTVHEILEHEGREILVMELVRGRSLRARLESEPLSPREAIRIAHEAARGLAAAHSIGIAHRDVKPENLMLRDDGLVKVLDFGLAGLESDDAADDRGLGTTAYLSPEQADGEPAGKAADVWALGCVLFELLAGRRAFSGATTRETLDAILEHEPDWSALPAATPPRVSAVLRACFEKRPEARPAIEAVVACLGEALSPEAEAVRRRLRHGKRIALATAAALGVVALAWSLRPAASGPDPPSTLAVLPFEWIGDVGRVHIADGITDETIASLGHLGGDRLRVIGRRSVLGYATSDKSLADIGRELGADLLLEGSVRGEGGNLRVTATLVRASDQHRLWSISLDGDDGRLLELQRELSALIARQVGTGLPADALARRQTRLPDAYDLYLRGRRLGDQLTAESNRQALELYQRAIELDPGYSLAWSGMAFLLAASPINGDVPPNRIWARAAEAARRAVEAEPLLAEAHTARGMIQFFLDWDWPGAEASLRRSIELDPSSSLSHRLLGHVLSQTARHGEARVQMDRARALDPFYAMNHANASQIAFQARDYDLAVARAREAIVIDPGFWIGHVMLGQATEQLGRTDAALASYLDAARLSGGNSKALAFRGHQLAALGRVDEARALLRALEGAAAERYVPPYARALVLAGLGEHAAALDALREAYDARDVHLVFLVADARWDPLRAEPGFQELIRRCGFTSD